MLWRLIKLLIGLAILCAIGIAVYAVVGDLAPPPSDHTVTVTLGDG